MFVGMTAGYLLITREYMHIFQSRILKFNEGSQQHREAKLTACMQNKLQPRMKETVRKKVWREIKD